MFCFAAGFLSADGSLCKWQGQGAVPNREVLAASVSAGFFYDFFKTAAGNAVEKSEIYAIVRHRSGFPGKT